MASSRFPRELKATLALALPVAATQMGQVSLGFIDTIMVGRLGSQALASVALGNTLFFFLFVLCMGVVAAVGPLVSQAYGAGEWEPVGRTARQGLWLALVLAVPVITLLQFAEPFLLAVGQEPETVEGTVAYLHAIRWGILPFLGFFALRNVAESLGRALPATLTIFAGMALNVGANYVLMFGHLGFPALGVAGTGWASTLVFTFFFSAMAVVIGAFEPFRSYRVFDKLGKPDLTYFRELFQVGWPIGISFGIEAGLFSVTALMMGWLGSTALAAHQIAIQCAAFTFMAPVGVSIATSVRVGQAVGRRDAVGVRLSGVAGITWATLFMMATAMLFWTMPDAIVALFLDPADPANVEVVQLAALLLGVAAVFQVVDGVQVAAAGALRGLKDTRRPMAIAFVSYWLIGLSAGYGLGFVQGYGPVGLWWGLVLGLAAAAVALTLRFMRRTDSPGMAEFMEPTPPQASQSAP
ncbi:MAG: MATE family efflux transporter [Bacteroidota bacterium]